MVTLTQQQLEAISTIERSNFCLFTGPPGSGKTTTLASWLSRISSKSEVRCFAPTGRAARRMSEAFHEMGVSRSASTIHSGLQPTRGGYDGGPWQFHFNSHNHLKADLVVIDECFVAGTMIDTESSSGKTPIERIKPGDKIINAIGVDEVVAVSKKEVESVVQIKAEEAEITCSENHPLFTQRGWVRAVDIRHDDCLMETETAMRLLRGDNHSGCMGRQEKILQLELQREMVEAVQGIQGEDIHSGTRKKMWSWKEKVSAVRKPGSLEADTENYRFETNAAGVSSEKSVGYFKGDGAQATYSGRERKVAYSSSEEVTEDTGKTMGAGVCRLRVGETEWLSHELQIGYCECGKADRNRSGRSVPQLFEPKGAGQKEGRFSFGKRVDSVEVLESGSSRLDRFRDAKGKLYLYDIKAARHQSFSVEGLLVHNCSMIDNEIMVALLSAIKPGTHVVLVGDPDQLPPIGAGLPFLDMINSGVVPHAKLTEIHRFAGRLAHACQRINQGLPIQFSKAMSIRSDAGEFGPENIIHVKTVNDAQKHEKLEKIIKHLMSKGRNIHRDVQALVSRNEDGPVNRKAVSSRIQWLVNPDVSKMNECEFGLGDKVMCKSNGFREGYRYDRDSEEFVRVLDQVYVANGESGIVRHVNEDRVMIDFGGNTLIKFSRDAWVNEKDLMLSYAITCHKAQGGGWPVIIYMIDSAKHVDRNLIYTAISRAKEMCFVIGDVDEMNTNIRKVLSDDRKTCVAEYLRELCT